MKSGFAAYFIGHRNPFTFAHLSARIAIATGNGVDKRSAFDSFFR